MGGWEWKPPRRVGGDRDRSEAIAIRTAAHAVCVCVWSIVGRPQVTHAGNMSPMPRDGACASRLHVGSGHARVTRVHLTSHTPDAVVEGGSTRPGTVALPTARCGKREWPGVRHPNRTVELTHLHAMCEQQGPARERCTVVGCPGRRRVVCIGAGREAVTSPLVGVSYNTHTTTCKM